MYHEVERKSSGRRAAQINVGVHIGIANTSMDSSGTCRILNRANLGVWLSSSVPSRNIGVT